MPRAPVSQSYGEPWVQAAQTRANLDGRPFLNTSSVKASRFAANNKDTRITKAPATVIDQRRTSNVLCVCPVLLLISKCCYHTKQAVDKTLRNEQATHFG